MCRYRIVQDGLPLLLPYVTRQLLQPTVQELLHLIEDRSLYVPEEARAIPAAVPDDEQPGLEVKEDLEPGEQQLADVAAASGVAASDVAAAASGVAAGSDVAAGVEVMAEEAEGEQAHVEGTGRMEGVASEVEQP